MNYWVCKGKAWNEFRSSLVPGKTAKWHTRKLPKQLSRGDIVFLWGSSPHCRLVGMAEVVDPDLGFNREGENQFSQRYLTKRFPSALGIEELRKVPVVNTSVFLKKGPASVLSKLNPEQAQSLLAYVELHNPQQVPKTLLQHVQEVVLPITYDFGRLSAEGRKKLMTHLGRERDWNLARAKRNSVLAKPPYLLACEVCAFDFGRRYGQLGEEFCEVHHTKPVGLRNAKIGSLTSLEDLAIVCSNCHRMLHKDGLKSISQLKKLLRSI